LARPLAADCHATGVSGDSPDSTPLTGGLEADGWSLDRHSCTGMLSPVDFEQLHTPSRPLTPKPWMSGDGGSSSEPLRPPSTSTPSTSASNSTPVPHWPSQTWSAARCACCCPDPPVSDARHPQRRHQPGAQLHPPHRRRPGRRDRPTPQRGAVVSAASRSPDPAGANPTADPAGNLIELFQPAHESAATPTT
jgi:hypothetical protein